MPKGSKRNSQFLDVDEVMLIFVSREELAELTGKRPNQNAAQVRALKIMGIAHWVRPDGRPMVLRSTLEGVPIPNPKRKSETEPNFETLT
ncbi:MAG: DUF4224 domain-containing protein [Chromatiaceae bacterium]|nr:DUF4224 domain-containing protein [Chromatiaceae bacterium]